MSQPAEMLLEGSPLYSKILKIFNDTSFSGSFMAHSYGTINNFFFSNFYI